MDRVNAECWRALAFGGRAARLGVPDSWRQAPAGTARGEAPRVVGAAPGEQGFKTHNPPRSTQIAAI